MFDVSSIKSSIYTQSKQKNRISAKFFTAKYVVSAKFAEPKCVVSANFAQK
jgi:hypothetical protein